MNDAEIRGMFLAAAAARREPPDGETRKALAGLVRRYLSENVFPSGKPEPKADWEEALEYVAGVFMQLDRVDPPGRAPRARMFDCLLKAVLEARGAAKPPE
jgi:hypothetical protein